MIAQMKCDDVVILIFDGVDYGLWRKRINKFLEIKKCKEVITRVKLETDKDQDWNHMESKAVNYIYSALSNRQLEYVEDTDTAYQIMSKFYSMYLNQSTALQIVCRTTVESIKLVNYSEVNYFFNAFEKCINDLKAAGAKVSEEEKLNYMLKSRPIERGGQPE